MAPFDFAALFGETGGYLVYLVIGFCFGFILESSGFGDSRILAAQFYFRRLNVLKVMFTAIVVAMLLIFWSTALGLLDYNEIWVKQTYLWPGIAGGIIMGVGFILGGYCPGTSLVSAATLKIDGMFFLAGFIAGAIGFGETVAHIEAFWHSGYLGVFTLPEFLGVETGVVVFASTLEAAPSSGLFGINLSDAATTSPVEMKIIIIPRADSLPHRPSSAKRKICTASTSVPGRDNTTEEILRWSPTGRVPALHHGEIRLWDSLAICEYLAETYPKVGLWPADAGVRLRLS